MRSNKFVSMVGLLALLGLGAYAQAADPLVVYSGRSDKFVKPVVDAFTQSSGVEVILHNAESTALLNKLRLEGKTAAADVYISNDAGNLQLGSSLGLFATLPDSVTGEIPANYRGADNTWVGLSARARVLVVNSNDAQAQKLSSIWEIADPKWKGKLGITSATNESFIAGLTVYLLSSNADKTKQWLEGIKKNTQGNTYAKHGAIVSDVAAGKLAVGLVNHYYVFRHLAEHPDAPIKIIMPDQDGMGVAWNVAGAAVVKHAKNAENATKLVAFFASPEGQKMFAEGNQEYPTRTNVAASASIPPANSFKVAPVPMSELATQRNATVDLIEQVGLP